MKVGIALLCRYNSSRLPGKILMEIKPGVRLLDFIIGQFDTTSQADLVVCTSDQSTDDIIVDHCINKGYSYFRGSLDDVAGRVLALAKDRDLDFIFRINGDNLFVDNKLIEKIKSSLVDYNCNLFSNVPERTYPYGMSTECIRVEDFYNKYAEGVLTENHKEHVTLVYYDSFKEEVLGYTNNTYNNLIGYKLAVDTKEDFLKAKEIVALLDDKTRFSLKEISEAINKYEQE